MKRVLTAMLLGMLALLALVLFLNFHGEGEIHDAPPLTPPSGESVARGEYLVRVGNCMTCHTERGVPYPNYTLVSRADSDAMFST